MLDRLGLHYARVRWENGKESFFYRGMYGIQDRWENNAMPDDLVLAVSAIFNNEKPVNDQMVDNWKMPPI